jgi:mono/diheme cytochrome c family protein
MLGPIHKPLLTMKLTLRHLLFSGAAVVAAALSAAPVAENWENHCSKCHGADGKGQTKAGKKAGAKDYTDAKVQAAMKDEEMAKAIANGINADGKEKMKAYKDELSTDEIKELVAYVRKFKP